MHPVGVNSSWEVFNEESNNSSIVSLAISSSTCELHGPCRHFYTSVDELSVPSCGSSGEISINAHCKREKQQQQFYTVGVLALSGNYSNATVPQRLRLG